MFAVFCVHVVSTSDCLIATYGTAPDYFDFVLEMYLQYKRKVIFLTYFFLELFRYLKLC